MNKEQILKAIVEEWKEYKQNTYDWHHSKLSKSLQKTMTGVMAAENDARLELIKNGFVGFMRHLTEKYGK